MGCDVMCKWHYFSILQYVSEYILEGSIGGG